MLKRVLRIPPSLLYTLYRRVSYGIDFGGGGDRGLIFNVTHR